MPTQAWQSPPGVDDLVGRIVNSVHPLRIIVFGSAARGDARPGSDLDLLVDMEEGRSLLDLVGFWQDLEGLLGYRVDVITDGGVSPYLRDQIYAEAIPL